MVKPVQKVEINSLAKGVITEASPLNFPADASRDEENFELNLDGTRQRRLGIDFESNYQLRSTGYNAAALKNYAQTSYKWFNAGRNSANEFIVVQFGSYIHVFDSANESVSRDGFKGSLLIAGTDPTKRFSFASIDGILIIASGIETITFVKWNGTTLTQTTDRLLVRDLWGVYDGYENNDINIRPSIQTNSHIYNLRNQGWNIIKRADTFILNDPILFFYSTFAKFPANSESVNTALSFKASTDSGAPYEVMRSMMWDDQRGVDIPPSKGSYIIDALKRGTSRLSVNTANQTKYAFTLSYPVTSLPTDTTSGGASVVADFAGRVFYAGFDGSVLDGDKYSPVLSSYVLFSQVSNSESDLIKCYQRGDPTSRENSDLVDTDGGFIRISGAKTILGLVALSDSLFVIADNGIWAIKGGSDYGFSATNYSVSKLSSYGCNNTNSIVSVNSEVFFFGDNALYHISKNQFGDWTVDNISIGSIQSLYDDIDGINKEKAFGIYDPFNKKIRWLYNQDLDRNNSNIVRELVFDLTLKAFTKSRIFNLSSNTPEVVAFIPSSSFTETPTDNNVVTGSNSVLASGTQVIVTQGSRSSSTQTIKYITLYSTVSGNVGFTFSQLKDVTFVDWKTADNVGVDAKAFIYTGTTTAGDSSIAKQTPYLVMHFLKTEDGVELSSGSLIPSFQSSCLVRSIWDWSTNSNSGKWSSLFQAYRYRRPLFITSSSDEYDNGFEIVTSKNKLRGRGKAFSLYLETEPLKDCIILGWSLSVTGNNLA